MVPTSKTHTVPEATINLSQEEGVAGSIIEVRGEGFKSFTQLSSLKIGTIDITHPTSSITGRDGMFTSSFTVPQLDIGTQTIEATVGGTVASQSFRIVAEAAPTGTGTGTGMMMSESADPAEAFAALIADDNLIRVWHFNAAEQNQAPGFGWSLYLSLIHI